MPKIERAALPLAALFCVPLVGVAQAQPTEPEVTVTAPTPVPFEDWAQRTEQKIDANLRYPRPMHGAPRDEGIVDVTFLCSDSGYPAQVTLDRSSGSRQLDRAGLRAVQNVGSLHPLAYGMKPNQVYRARLFFAQDDMWGGAQRRYGALRDDATRHNAEVRDAWGNGVGASRIMLVPASAR